MRILIDTNVVIDVLQKREPFFEASHAVLLSCASSEDEGLLTAKAITDIFYVMHRFYHENAPCIDAVRKLYDILEVVDTSASDCYNATFSPLADYEDAVMAEAAKREHAELIVTRNVADFKGSAVRAVDPATFYDEVIAPRKDSEARR